MSLILKTLVHILVVTNLIRSIQGQPIIGEEADLAKEDKRLPVPIFQRIWDEISLRVRDFTKLSSEFNSFSRLFQEKNENNSQEHENINRMMSEMKSELIQRLESEILGLKTELRTQVSQMNKTVNELADGKLGLEKIHGLTNQVAQTNKTLNTILNELEGNKGLGNIYSVVDEMKESISTIETELKLHEELKDAEIKTISQKLSSLDTKLGSMSQAITTKDTQIQRTYSDLLPMVYKLRMMIPENGAKVASYYWNRNVVDLYYQENHKGRVEKVDFSNCAYTGSCCKNLVLLSANSESINTHNSCVIMYYETDCKVGKYAVFYPESENPHNDFGVNKNKFKSIGTCF